MKTRLSIREESFLINDRPVYAEIPAAPKSVHGLLMNARFIQGIFDDKAGGVMDPSFLRSLPKTTALFALALSRTIGEKQVVAMRGARARGRVRRYRATGSRTAAAPAQHDE